MGIDATAVIVVGPRTCEWLVVLLAWRSEIGLRRAGLAGGHGDERDGYQSSQNNADKSDGSDGGIHAGLQSVRANRRRRLHSANERPAGRILVLREDHSYEEEMGNRAALGK